jgi:uncharacterized membrane protein (UPF0127 family)
MKDFFFLVLGLAIIFGSVFLYSKGSEWAAVRENRVKIIKINDIRVRAEIADTSSLREQGLSGRRSLADGRGMLFVFNTAAQHGFWMKDMNFSIDIVWIDAGLRVAGVEKRISPETFPQIFYPPRAVKYALELPSGFSDVMGIDTGMEVFFEN